jgi:hypothetical protein
MKFYQGKTNFQEKLKTIFSHKNPRAKLLQKVIVIASTIGATKTKR